MQLGLGFRRSLTRKAGPGASVQKTVGAFTGRATVTGPGTETPEVNGPGPGDSHSVLVSVQA